MPRLCSVSGCAMVKNPIWRFPIQCEEIMNLWIQRIANPLFDNKSHRQIYDYYGVCSHHFIPSCFVSGDKLRKFAIPSVQIPGFDEEPRLSNSFRIPAESNDTNFLQTEIGIAYLDDCSNAELNDFNVYIATDELCDISAFNAENNDSGASASLIDLNLSVDTSGECIDIPTTISDSGSLPPFYQTDVDVEHDKDVPGYICSSPISQRKRNYSCDETPKFDTKRQCYVQQEAKSNVRYGKRRVQRVRDLSPTTKRLYDDSVMWKRKAKALEKKSISYKKRLDVATQVARSGNFTEYMGRLTTTSYNFLLCQLRNFGRKKRGHRFTIQDKVLALALMKQSGRGYRLLSRIFSLPSKSSVLAVLQHIPIRTGINSKVMVDLKKRVKQLKGHEKQCVLAFDEMAISAQLQYTEKSDMIHGFEDFGGNARSGRFASHAIVFMIRGVTKRFKQPIAFYFSDSATKSAQLKVLIRDVIVELQRAGLRVIATVCDQAANNRAAINLLRKETLDHYNRGGGIQKKATWRHVLALYRLDEGAQEVRLCPRLTELHVEPNKIRKMKVSYAAQVFSQRVSAVMRKLAQWTGSGRGDFIDPEATGTADFLLFIDKLFDSCNGSTIFSKGGKSLRCALTKDSPHADFWQEAIGVLKTVKFIDPKTNSRKVVPSVLNWIHNLKTFLYMKRALLNVNVKFLSIRNFNQDPLENFFCCIRSHGVRNINPSCSQFCASFKTLVVNNLLSSHSISANCEEDDESALQNLQEMILDVDENAPQPEVPVFTFSDYNRNQNLQEVDKEARKIMWRFK